MRWQCHWQTPAGAVRSWVAGLPGLNGTFAGLDR